MNITLSIKQPNGDTLTLPDVPRRVTVDDLKKHIKKYFLLYPANQTQWSGFAEKGCILLDNQQLVASFKHHSNTILHFGEFDSTSNYETINLVWRNLDDDIFNYNAIESKKIYAVTSEPGELKTKNYSNAKGLIILLPLLMMLLVGVILVRSLELYRQAPSDESKKHKMISQIAASGLAFVVFGHTLFYKAPHWASLEDPNDLNAEQTEANALLLPQPATAPGNV